MRNARYDILFELLAIGAVTASNRFDQVPPSKGRGRMFANAVIAMRGARAEGEWNH